MFILDNSTMPFLFPLRYFRPSYPIALAFSKRGLSLFEPSLRVGDPSPVGHRRFKYPAPVAPLVGVHHVLEAFVVAKGLNGVTKFEYGIVFAQGWTKLVPGNKMKQIVMCCLSQDFGLGILVFWYISVDTC